MIFKITYYDEIEAETEDKAYKILRKQLASDVKFGDISCFEFEEVIEGVSDDNDWNYILHNTSNSIDCYTLLDRSKF